MVVFLFILIPSLLIGHTIPFTEVLEYFPLKEGNIWIYSLDMFSNKEYLVVEAVKEDSKIFLKNYFFSKEKLEFERQGNYVYINTEKGKFLIYKFEEDGIWHIPEFISLDPICLNDSYLGVVEKGFAFSSPIGVFTNCIRILWDSPCYDAGILEEVFAPDVGLIRRVEDSYIGPLSYELIYAYVNGVIYGELSFSFEGGVFPEFIKGENIINFEFKNNTSKEIVLTFPTSQTYDFILQNQNGDILYKWSEGKSFLEVLTAKTIPPFGKWEEIIKVSFPEVDKGIYNLKIIIPATLINSYPIKEPISSSIYIFSER